MRNDPEVKEARRILLHFVGDDRKPGIAMLGEYYERWGVPKDRALRQVVQDFAPLIEAAGESLQGKKHQKARGE